MPETQPLALTVAIPHSGRDNTSPHTDKLFPALTNNGFSLTVLCWDRSRSYPQIERTGDSTYKALLRGGAFGSKRVAAWLPVWFFRVGVEVLKTRPDLIMAVDFETAVPVALASRVTRGRYLYNLRDNFALRKRYPRFLRRLFEAVDLWIMSRAEAVILPDESRIPDRVSNCKFLIAPNGSPDLEGSPWPLADYKRIVVYAMGYLRTSRGIGLLLDAIENLPQVRVIAAGACAEDELRHRLEQHPRVDYRGVLPPTAALQLLAESDAVLTLYDPKLPINRLAVSNKWSDAMMAGRPIIVNREVKKSGWLAERRAAVTCAYELGDLRATLSALASDPQWRKEMGRNGRQIYDEGYRWEVTEHLVIDTLRALI